MSNPDVMSWEDAVNWLISQPDQKDLVNACYFDRPVIDALKRYANSAEWKALKNYIPQKSGEAFDLGAGNGIVSYALAKDGWKVTALEPDASNFVGAGAIQAVADSEDVHIEVLREWGESISCADDRFDIVMARQVMHHARDLNLMFKEMSRILRPGGTLIAFRDHIVDSDEGLEIFKNEHPLHKLYGGENAFRLEQYINGIEEAGLTIVETIHHFDSVINYAPRSQKDVTNEVAARLKLPLAVGAAKILFMLPLMSEIVMKLASHAYRTKQGRLVSFICKKPGD